MIFGDFYQFDIVGVNKLIDFPLFEFLLALQFGQKCFLDFCHFLLQLKSLFFLQGLFFGLVFRKDQVNKSDKIQEELKNDEDRDCSEEYAGEEALLSPFVEKVEDACCSCEYKGRGEHEMSRHAQHKPAAIDEIFGEEQHFSQCFLLPDASGDYGARTDKKWPLIKCHNFPHYSPSHCHESGRPVNSIGWSLRGPFQQAVEEYGVYEWLQTPNVAVDSTVAEGQGQRGDHFRSH